MTSLTEWLNERGFAEHAQLFADNDVDLATLLILTDANLKELGLSFGARKRLLNALAEYKAARPEPMRTADGHRPRRVAGLHHRDADIIQHFGPERFQSFQFGALDLPRPPGLELGDHQGVEFVQENEDARTDGRAMLDMACVGLDTSPQTRQAYRPHRAAVIIATVIARPPAAPTRRADSRPPLPR